MINDRILILDKENIRQKIKRIAYEIFESNFQENALIIAGIVGQGYELARQIMIELNGISDISTQLVEVAIDKAAPHYDEISLDIETEKLKGINVILVDDVLNTGRTMAYSLRPFLEIEINKIEIAVLVDRGHSRFPVKANFTGLELSTTLNDHIEVVLKSDEFAVYLN